MNSAELRERLERFSKAIGTHAAPIYPGRGNVWMTEVGADEVRDLLDRAAAALERLEALERQNAALRHREDLAWGLIANANGGDWTGASPEWQEAARRWQRGYEITTPAPAGQQGGADV